MTTLLNAAGGIQAILGSPIVMLKTSDGDEILKNHDTVLVKFGPKRNGIVTSWLNGGYSEDLSAVFNHQLSQANIDKYGDGGILDFLRDLSADLYNDLNEST